MDAYQHHARNDQWVAEVVFPGLRNAFFVEAGACGGVHQSATYILETEFDWDGICVEPFDEYYELLIRHRSCRTDPRCLWNVTGQQIDFLTYPDDRARSGILATNKNESDGWAERNGARGTTTTKETVTLSDLLEQHNAPDTVHYLCLDVEGAERNILDTFDFAVDRKILALTIEGKSCDARLASYGYVKITNPHVTGHPDQYFVHSELIDRLGHLRAD